MVSETNMIALAGIAGLVLVGALCWLFYMEYRLRKLMAGKTARTLEHIITENMERIAHSERLHTQTAEYIRAIDERLKKAVRTAKIVRFNAFTEGGHQSFATALIDETGDGVIISTLHARERVGVFGKPIKNFLSEYELSAEEQEALHNVRRS